MSKPIYNRTIKSLTFYQQVVNDLINKRPFNRNNLIFSLDHNKITSEFDLLKRELPESFKKYLKHLLNNYELIDHLHDKLNKNNNQNDEERIFDEYSQTDDNEYYIEYFSQCLKHIIYHLKGMLKTEILPPQQNERTEKIIGLKSEDLPERLGKIFDSLNKDKPRIDPKRKADFVSIFQGDELKNWKPVEWTGSNPELATLVHILAGIEPEPSTVTTYFDPIKKYDSNSKGGKKDSKGRNRNTNIAITRIVNNCRK